MRAVKIAVAVMSMLIVVGTTVLVVTVINRMATPAATVVVGTTAAVMDEPAGTAITGIATAGDRLAVQLRGGGPDRVVFVDPRTATVAGRISLAK